MVFRKEIHMDNSNEAVTSAIASIVPALDVFEGSVEHHFALNNGVKIHYAATGSGPLLVFIHGFPDHWLGWWRQMSVLRNDYRVVAMDLRGYNLSDKPASAEAYEINNLVADVRAVIEHEGVARATVIGHDWGGFVAWHAAMDAPDMVDRLIVLNMPHPWAIARELANNPLQKKASEYVRLFRQPLSHTQIPLARLSAWVTDSAYQSRNEHAMKASSIDGLLNYYRKNWPAEPYQEIAHEPPHVKAPTLLIYGLEDVYALPVGLNGVWKWVDSEVTILTIPNAGHFVQHERPERVSRAIGNWLAG
jgi:pimeloyl-ACP methyl ester carboxylesterase